MSRRNFRNNNGTKLPFALTKELGLQETQAGSRGKRQYGGNTVADRKQRRKVLGAGKGRSKNFRHDPDERDENRWDEKSSTGGEDLPRSTVNTQPLRSHNSKGPQPSQPFNPAPKRKDNKVSSPSPSLSHDTSGSDRSRSPSPGLVLDPNSSSFRKHARNDDDEIAALERRLGIKSNKKSRLGDDMLDFVLGDLEEEEDTNTNRRRDGQDWLDQKRRTAAEANDVLEDELEDSDEFESLGDQVPFEDERDDEDDVSDLDEEYGDLNNQLEGFDESVSEAERLEDDSFDGFGSDDADIVSERALPKRIRENPYVAPVDPGVPTKKYIPPSLRRRADGSDSGLEQLVRLVQGHLNKLSEANLISILGEIEKVYRTNPRQDVTQVLIDRIFASFLVRSALQKTFVILHAAFLAAVYKVMGSDFGAELLTRLVERFNLELGKSDGGKEAYNLLNLLANLFNFGVVSSNIIYDHVRLLLSDFSENNTELLLCVMDACGPQLRSDDPPALKDIVKMMQTVSKEMENEGRQASVRTKFMMERIVDLKNNKMKTANNIALMTGEHIKRMKKALGSLNNRTLKATEPLRITRTDIANSEKVGKWWLVGASWKGNEVRPVKDAAMAVEETRITGDESSDTDENVDLLALAKQYRMNTDVRRSIFVAIMSADDCRDARTRLLKLRLSTKQEQEIAKVLLRCARAEPAYNPYYALLAKSLCKDNKKVRMGFQFGLWDFFKRMGESEDDDGSDVEDTETSIELHEIVNVAKMYAHLIFHDYLPVGILKALNIGFLKEQATMFLEILLISIMTQPNATEEELIRVFGKTADTPQMMKSLQYFVKKNVRKSDLVSKKERPKVKEGCHIVDATLKTVESAREG